jgi:DNA-binding PadR family transcriptional regulator
MLRAIGTCSPRRALGGGLNQLSDRATLVLTSLAGGDKHAYALTKDVKEFAGVTLGPGTLYSALTRLEREGLIERLEADERRCPYRITTSGREVLAQRLAESSRLAGLGLQRMAVSDR